MKKTLLILALALGQSGISRGSSLIVTYAEQAGAMNSTLSGTSVYDFNNNPLGKSTNVAWSGVGTFDQLYVLNADTYGGATDATHPNGTRYSVQGVGTSVLKTTLSLDEASSYFGLWWSAGDAKNVLQFYNGDALIAEFTTANLLAALPADYFGNPRNRSLDRSEPFAFINFFGDANTAWDRIVFQNNGSSGFESDNYTTREMAWSANTDGALPGVPVAMVSGTTTTKVTTASLAGTRWAAVPGAPAPPMPLLVAFGIAVIARCRRFVQQTA